MAMSQMNVRIDEKLRTDGNLALASIGWSPSRAIRAIWEYAAAHRESPAVLIDTLEQLESSGEETSAINERLALANEGAALVQNALRSWGLRPSPELAAMSYDELRDLAYDEKVDALLQ